MSKQVCWDAMRAARGGGVVARNMLPHDIRDVTRPVSRPVASEQVYELVIVENNAAGGVFDPAINTAVSTTILWQSSDGYVTATTGTSHALSYTVPANGPRRWVIRCTAGLRAITRINSSIDGIVSDYPVALRRCNNLTSIIMFTNSGAKAMLKDIARYFPCLTAIVCGGSGVVGQLSDLGSLPILICDINFTPGLTGSLAGLGSATQKMILYSCPNLTPSSIAGYQDITEMQFQNNGWNQAGVDTVLLSISDAIHANTNHFTYAKPSIQIGGSGGTANAAPGGTASAATTSPLTTPGSGNSDNDWQWDAVAGKHKALTGMAAIYVMRNNTGHVWTVTATGIA